MFDMYKDKDDDKYYGKIIFADKLAYRHYGIGYWNNQVVHFDFKSGENGLVVASSLREFSKGFPIRECFRTKATYSPDDIVWRANQATNTDFGGYDFIHNNCEHFTSWCASGIRTSSQVFFTNDDQNIIEKTIDRVLEPARCVQARVINAFDKTVEFFKITFGI